MLLILDSNFVLHKALAVNPKDGFLTHNNQITGGVYGFLQTLQKIMSSGINPSKVISVWDGSISDRRKKLLPEYKKNRLPKTMEEIKESEDFRSVFNGQKELLQNKFLPSLGILSVLMPQKEADDVIYQICKLYQDEELIVVSEDKDLLQLINNFDSLKVYQPIKERLITKSNFLEEIEIEPEAFLYHKAIVGDPSDNIVGVNGVGKVTAKKILQSLDLSELPDSLYDYSVKEMTKVKKKKNKKLTRGARINEYWGTIARNLELMELNREEFGNKELFELKQSINNFERKVYTDYFKACCLELGFNRFLNNLNFWLMPFVPTNGLTCNV